jgi:transcriptional regulator GlxA family with amidase domain
VATGSFGGRRLGPGFLLDDQRWFESNGPGHIVEVRRGCHDRLMHLGELLLGAVTLDADGVVQVLIALRHGRIDPQEASTLILAGSDEVPAAATCEKTLSFVRTMARRGVRVASVCSGAYILAAAGLLDGRRATTHWRRTRHFLTAYPKVKLEADRIFVRDGNIWSSAGITAGIDLALAMVAEDLGDEIAQNTARALVLYHRRSGGQSQFSSLLELKAPSGRFAPLLSWAREHLDAPLTVEDLAERAGMSSRHFTRAFIAETGTTPSKAVERLRIEVARHFVQSSGEAIERVAQLTGFRDPERMRRAFIRAFGQPPQSLRRAARAG